MDNKKSQSSIEFSVIMGFAILLFVVFILAIQASLGSKAYEKNNLILKNLALSVQDEINLALESSDGYHRNFNIPEKLNGREYEINITQEMVYIRTADESYAIALPVPNATGDVKKGANMIRKEGGIILINNATIYVTAPPPETFFITSSFGNGGIINQKYTCDGANISLSLNITETPAGTQSFTIIFDDPDIDFNHWLLWNISSTYLNISENSVPAGAIQGINDFGLVQYSGPCPPAQHRYSVKLYALNNNINLSAGSMRPQLDSAMSGHIIKTAELIGYYG